MLLIGLAGTSLLEQERSWLTAHGVSGVILFSRNFSSREQLIELVESIRAVGGDDLLIAVDQEGGRVQRFREGFTPLPALSKIGAVFDRDPTEAIRLAEEHAWLMASELRACGIDFSFAPVADLARGNTAIGERAFHADPMVTAELVQAYLRGLHLAGMAAVLKHFPGHGSVLADTHVATALDPRPLTQIQAEDVLPFAEALASRAEAVMMAHVIYPQVDPRPAGYSARWIGDILRADLQFRGIVFSDDISMAAAVEVGGVAARVSAHLDAGCDLVLACFPEVVPAAIAAVAGRDPLSTDRLATLRGAVASTWAGLQDNPQRQRFITRVTALES